jgi:pimeloyl-ACP methyl ester carboxylesterase
VTSLRDSKLFLRLSDGRCHYSIEGPTDGKPLLLIHGATVPAWEFDRIVPYLTANGFRCLRPDLFGMATRIDRGRTTTTRCSYASSRSYLLLSNCAARFTCLATHSVPR